MQYIGSSENMNQFTRTDDRIWSSVRISLFLQSDTADNSKMSLVLEGCRSCTALECVLVVNRVISHEDILI